METEDLPVHFVESLQHMAAVKIITTLLRLPKIKMEINRLVGARYSLHMLTNNDSNHQYFKDIENVQKEIRACVLELPIPNLLQVAVSDVIEFVFDEILNWIEYNDLHVFDLKNVPVSRAFQFFDEIVFKSEGLLDYVATARSVLKTNKLNDEEKFQIISSYCLQDLMNTISSDLLQPNFRESLLKSNKLIQYYWLCSISGNLNEINKIVPQNGVYSSLNKFLINHSQRNHHVIAVEYFWNKLSVEEKIDSVSSIAQRRGMRASYVISFVNEMGLHEKLVELILIGYGSFLTTVIFDMYWRKYFSQISRRFRDTLSYNQLEDFCESFGKKACLLDLSQRSCLRFFPTFMEFWNTIPVATRRAVFKRDYFDLRYVLLHLHNEELMDETVKWFADMDYETVKNFLFSRQTMEVWYNDIKDYQTQDKLEKLYIFLFKILSKDDALELFEQIRRFDPDYDPFFNDSDHYDDDDDNLFPGMEYSYGSELE